ncbi:hypothetical protein N7492_000130 [Penicillium capsulatum]|uniref:Uncharacterized protein n=1 Tax=Penicillium capsulatum TaxID=69766 RepID=A0A9W9LZ28_9EURO|nr:hypothetical protein N7492_000130 [Penicillium capsulatum]KAJ6130804.1 hypothetical protein N7512_003584 [Penicillium capsulatum]
MTFHPSGSGVHPVPSSVFELDMLHSQRLKAWMIFPSRFTPGRVDAVPIYSSRTLDPMRSAHPGPAPPALAGRLDHIQRQLTWIHPFLREDTVTSLVHDVLNRGVSPCKGLFSPPPPRGIRGDALVLQEKQLGDLSISLHVHRDAPSDP